MSESQTNVGSENMSESINGGQVSLIDRFLEEARIANRQISVYLVNGFQLKGDVVAADKETILFKHRDVHQLIMRSAVATVYPLPHPKGDSNGWWRGYAAGLPEA